VRCHRARYCTGCSDCYDATHCTGCRACYAVTNCDRCEHCVDSSFLILCTDCAACEYCFGCVGLTGKDFHILNKRYSRGDYFRLVKALTQELAKA
jgi:hypothetical protein